MSNVRRIAEEGFGRAPGTPAPNAAPPSATIPAPTITPGPAPVGTAPTTGTPPSLTPNPTYSGDTEFGRWLREGNNGDAWATFEKTLSDFGLDDLIGTAQDWAIEGLGGEEMMLKMRQTEPYRKRFSAIIERQKKGLPAISESEVIDLERQMAQTAAQAGLPPGFYDDPQTDFAKLIAGDVSAKEFESRVLAGYVAVRNDPRIAGELDRFYGAGLTDGDLVAFYLDPDRAVTAIQTRQAAATISSRAQATGFGGLSLTQAERLAGQGVSAEDAQRGFGELSAQRDLFDPLAGEQGSITRDEALAATFGSSSPAAERIARRRQERLSNFSGSGGYQTNQRGSGGAGTSNV